MRATDHVARYANACVRSTSWPLRGAAAGVGAGVRLIPRIVPLNQNVAKTCVLDPYHGGGGPVGPGPVPYIYIYMYIFSRIIYTHKDTYTCDVARGSVVLSAI